MEKKLILNELSKRWIKSGLREGDTFLLHANIRRLLFEFKKKKIALDINIIIDSFLNVIGKNGTLLMPLFNFDFTTEKFFSLNKTISKMGSLSENFRINYNVLRTRHPVYSFGVLGKNVKKFDINNFSAYGEDSPFDILRKLNGKIGVLDISEENSMTFYHHIEEMNNVNWRYHKIFKGIYEEIDGKISEKKYSIFVRDLDKGVVTHVKYAGELLWRNGLYKGFRENVDTGLRLLNTKDTFNFISEIIQKGKAEGILYKLNEFK